ncbi:MULTISPECIES: hypothetical protein [unclassified Nocardioides]|jgi:hypothetical protein|uniref:hypothetical protein n=1 Tax=unclassified Nocardioides TaxID=2615069 RepID=UPI000702F2A6|nr:MULTISPECIES: hypothetical protein [unclassified Nocardioides]KRC59520.1 hypothetical protein ASE19_00315 [Nocardioides sp. Root79]KRC68656.1 hypothetical protein ASE20_17650 [Nocardioides sp. Root240]
MAGEHIKKLETWVNGMNVEDVSDSQTAWRKITGALVVAQVALELAAPKIGEGFGDSDLGTGASEAFLAAAKRLETQRLPMGDASSALLQVESDMKTARTTINGAAKEPGEAPKEENYPGLPRLLNLPLALAEAQHTAEVNAYNQSDDDARKQIEQLNKSYGEAIVVFTKIHGDPYVPIDPDGTRQAPTPGTPGAPTVPTSKPKGTVRDPHVDIGRPVDPPVDPPIDKPWPPVRPPVDVWPPIDIGDPEWPDPDFPDPEPPTTTDPTGPGGTGGGVHPGVLGGGLLAGGLATPGAVNGIRGLLSRGGLSSGGAGAIGSSSRAGGPGSLGRSGGTGAGAPGSQAGRGGGRGGGSAGSQAGRGGRGGRSGGAGGAGGRGNRRKDDRDPSNEQDLYDDGKDWLDDEGTAPGVLG